MVQGGMLCCLHLGRMQRLAAGMRETTERGGKVDCQAEVKVKLKGGSCSEDGWQSY